MDLPGGLRRMKGPPPVSADPGGQGGCAQVRTPPFQAFPADFAPHLLFGFLIFTSCFGQTHCAFSVGAVRYPVPAVGLLPPSSPASFPWAWGSLGGGRAPGVSIKVLVS